ncbi:MAG: histidinol-phosphatase, partial [Thermoanaerobacteraceae bacterium]
MIYNADLHVHIGSTIDGSPIKITASKQLTILNILEESLKKGLDIVGIIDSASPKVINEINFHIDNGTLVPIKGGGLKYKNKLTLILGSEIEIGKDEKGSPHLLAYFKTIEDINQFSNIIKKSIKNINLSSQRCRLNSIEVLKIVSMLGGFVIP